MRILQKRKIASFRPKPKKSSRKSVPAKLRRKFNLCFEVSGIFSTSKSGRNTSISRIWTRQLKLAAAAAPIAFSGSFAVAECVAVGDGYAFLATARSKSGAAYFTVKNCGESADRLLEAISEDSRIAELHTHRLDADGVMRMEKLDDGIEVPPGNSRVLQQGGNHLMLMGLTRSFAISDSINVTLIFERAGEIGFGIARYIRTPAVAPSDG